jgi:putative addiction module component (TIGR02574 family)
VIVSFGGTVDQDAEAAWQQEIARRLEEVRSGKVKTTSWDDVRQKGRSLLQDKYPQT